MFRPRIIPVLLLKGKSLVKSTKFKDYRYIGDPINAVRIFNDLKADELVFLDITATCEKRLIPVGFVKEVGEEANMPFAIGGGIRSVDDIRSILEAGAEKVIITSSAISDPEFIKEAAGYFGSSTIVVCIDVKKGPSGNHEVWSASACRSTGVSPVVFAKKIEELGSGEIIIQSVDKDGTMTGYDIGLIRTISEAVSVPVIALGGAGSIKDLKCGFKDGLASGLAAGSLFVYQGRNRGVLINYPDRPEMSSLAEQ